MLAAWSLASLPVWVLAAAEEAAGSSPGDIEFWVKLLGGGTGAVAAVSWGGWRVFNLVLKKLGEFNTLKAENARLVQREVTKTAEAVAQTAKSLKEATEAQAGLTTDVRLLQESAREIIKDAERLLDRIVSAAGGEEAGAVDRRRGSGAD